MTSKAGRVANKLWGVFTFGWTTGSATIGVPEQMIKAFVEDDVRAFFTSFSCLILARTHGRGVDRGFRLKGFVDSGELRPQKDSSSV